MQRSRVLTSLATVLTAILLLGCGAVNKAMQKAAQEAAEEQRREDNLEAIGEAYHSYLDANNKKAPTKADDLIPLMDANGEAAQKLKDGSIVFIYGVTVEEMNEPDGDETVLAYEVKVPTEGGIVLMGDGSTQKVTAAEFKEMTLAKPGVKKDQKGGKDDKPKKDDKKVGKGDKK